MEMIDLQNEFAIRLANSVKGDWDELRVHYENAEVEGVLREVFVASLLLAGTKQNITVPLEAIDILGELRVHKPAGQVEDWKWIEFSIDKTGKYKFNYKYDNPPLIMDQIKYSK